MKQFCIFLTGMLLFIQTSYSQAPFAQVENFDDWTHTFNAIPANSWQTTTHFCVSSPRSILGKVPNLPGDSIILETPVYNLTGYTRALLKFMHICKVSPSDTVRIYYKKPYQVWTLLERSGVYEGSGFVSGTYLQFNAATYPAWEASNNNTQPTQSWWREEILNVSYVVAGENSVQFRFVIKKGNTVGSDFAYGWLIDDFQIIASDHEIRPPTVAFVAPFVKDTLLKTGPFTVNAKIKTNTSAPLVPPYLKYTYTLYGKSPVTDSIAMTKTAGDTMWQATLPHFPHQTSVNYSISGVDAFGNTSTVISSYYIKYIATSSATGPFTAGTGTTGTGTMPIYASATNGLASSKQLYLASEINSGQGGVITKLSWMPNTTFAGPLNKQKCYMRVVDTTALTTGAFTPIADGAFLVWSGSISNLTAGTWKEITLDEPFMLLPGKNLVVYWLNEHGTATTQVNWLMTSNTNRALYASGTTYLTGTGTISSNRPNARFLLGNADDNSVGLTSFEAPSGEGALAGVSTPIKVLVKNKGIQNLTSVQIAYRVNAGGTVFTNTYPVNLSWDFDTVLTIGSYLPRLNNYDTITAWISQRNGSVEIAERRFDDTLRTMVYGCGGVSLSGTFTIGSSATADFASWNAFAFAIKTCGVGGDITAKFESGNYGKMSLRDFVGINGNYTLTITSKANHKDSVRFVATDTAFIIDNTNSLIVDAVTIDVSASSTGMGIYFGGANNVTIRNCNVFASVTGATAVANSAIYKPSNSKVIRNIIIKNNIIRGGYYGICIIGVAAYINEFIFADSNTIDNQYYYASNITYSRRVDYSNNFHTPRNNTYQNTLWRGINLSYVYSSNITGNRVYSRTPTFSGHIYGIYANNGDTSIYANNEVYIYNPAAGNTYGLYVDNQKGTKVLHNSILISGLGGGTFRCFAGTATANYGLTVKNNIFIADGQNPASTYAVSLTVVTAINNGDYIFNYNTYYSTGNIGYAGTAQATLDNWKSIVQTDQYSTEDLYPAFNDTAQNLSLASFTGLNCPMEQEVQEDIEKTRRMGITTRGCYTLPTPPVSVSVIDVVDWKLNAYNGDTAWVKVVVQSLGTNPLTGVTLNYRWNNGTAVQVSKNMNLNYGETDTVVLAKFTYPQGINTLQVYLNNVPGDAVTADDTLRIENYTCFEAMYGNYTIGASSNANFRTVNDAIFNLEQCGIKAPVVIKYEPGTYLQTAVMKTPIRGSSPVNTITFTSATGNANDVVLQRQDADTAGLGTPFALENVENIIFSRLTLNGYYPTRKGNPTYSRGISIGRNCKGIEVSNCRISVYENRYVAYGSVERTLNGVSINYEAGVRDIRILNNVITGGACGVYVRGNGATERTKNVLIEGNTITTDYYGIYAYYADSTFIRRNTIKQRVGDFDFSNMQGIYTYYMASGDIVANKINLPNMYSGIYTIYAGDTSRNNPDTILIANNEIMGTISSTSYGAIYLGSLTIAKIYHNSISVEGSGIRGIYAVSHVLTRLFIENNIIKTKSTSSSADYPMYFGFHDSVARKGYINNNCYFTETGGANIGYVTSAARTFTAWKGLVTSDSNSVNVRPAFYNAIDLKLLDTVGQACTSLVDVPTDISNNVHGTVTNRGAYRYKNNPNDVALMKVIVPEYVTTGVPSNIEAIIFNAGSDTLRSLRIGYEENGVATPYPYLWTGTLAPGETSAAITVTNSFMPVTYTNTVRVFTFSPNNGVDGEPINDTLEVTTFGCQGQPLAAGTYTVGQNGYFSTIKKAVSTLLCGGIDGPVEIAILPGEYYETVVIDDIIPGSDATNTVTITSSTNDTNDVYIEWSKTFLLKNTGYLRIKNLSIYGGIAGINLEGNGTDIEIYGCKIEAATGANSTYRPIGYTGSITSSDKLDNVRIIANHIIGGHTGVYMSATGIGGDNGANMGMVTIDSNTIDGYSNNGIYTSYSRLNSVSYNTVTMMSGTSTTAHGIDLNINTVITDGVIGNKVRTRGYGLYIYNVNQSANYGATGRALIANNEVYALSTGLALYNSNVSAYHNSVYAYGSATVYGLYFSYSNLNYTADIKNNIFVTFPTGATANGYAVYAPGTPGSSAGNYYLANAATLDYNNYYTPTTNLGCYTYVDQNGSGSTTTYVKDLAALKGVTKSDFNSISEKPNFQNDSLSLAIASVGKMSCPKLPLVQTDIANSLRLNTTNMGAYVVPPVSIDGSFIRFYAFNRIAAGVPTPVYAIVENAGLTPLTASMGMTITGTLNGTPFASMPYNPTKPLVFGAWDTVSIGTLTFNLGENKLVAAINVPGDISHDNDTIRITGEKCAAVIGGDCIIGRSASARYPNYQAFADAVRNCGINADVTLKYEPGTYNGRLVLSDFDDNFMDGFHLTITSLNGNKNSVIFVDSTGGNSTSLVTLRNVRNFTLDKVTLNAFKNTHAVKLDADRGNYNIAITNCIMRTDTTITGSTSYDTVGVIFKPNRGELEDLLIRNNVIAGGWCGVRLYGYAGRGLVKNAIIDGNEISGNAYVGIYTYYVENSKIKYNTIVSRTANQYTVWHGIMHYIGRNIQIEGNRITGNPGTNSTIRGITISDFNGETSEINILNNQIYLRSTGTVAVGGTCGIYVSSVKNNVVMHNTVFAEWAGAIGQGNPLGLYTYVAAAGSGVIKNNIFSVKGGATSYAMYLSQTSAVNFENYIKNFKIDNNIMYSTGDIGYANSTPQPTMEDWRLEVPSDVNSLNIEPVFQNTNNLKVLNFAQFITNRVPEVGVDILGKPRNEKTIIGAYEHDYVAVDATLSAFVVPFITGQQMLKVVLTNMGEDTLRTATISWNVNNGATTQYAWSGKLATTESDTVELGLITLALRYNTLKAIVSKPNNGTDLNVSNDTLVHRAYACTGALSGNYIIGSSSRADFASMDDAVFVLKTCGVQAPVVMQFENGTYYQNTTIEGIIPGSSATNTVTFTSLSRNYASVTLRRADTSNASVAPVMLYRAANIIFNHLSFNGYFHPSVSKAYYYSHGLIMDASSNITIHNCNLVVPYFISTILNSNQNSLRILNKTSNIQIYDNIIQGGGYGILVKGTSTAKASNILIKNNLIKVVDTRGISVEYTDTVTVVNNTIQQRENRPDPGTNGLDGIYLSNSYAEKIVNNSIKAEAMHAGIYTTYLNSATGASPALIANNEIFGIVMTVEHVGAQLYSNTNADFLHNSIALAGSTIARGIHLYNSNNTSVKGSVKNNNISLYSTVANYPIMLYSATTANVSNVNINSNNYYSVNGAFWGGQYTTATATITGINENTWKNTVPSDKQSVSVEPHYIDVMTNLELKDIAGLLCAMDSLVLSDKLGKRRDSLTVMGAYGIELSAVPDLALVRVSSPVNSTSLCAPYYMPLRCDIRNVANFDWDFAVNPFDLHVEVSGDNLPSFDTVITINTGRLAFTETATFELKDQLNVSFAGVYNIKAWISSSADAISDNDTIYTSYQSTKIGLPFDYYFDEDILDKRLVSEALLLTNKWEVTKLNTIIAPVFGDGKLMFAAPYGSMSRLYTTQMELNRTIQPKLEFWYAHDNTNPTGDDRTYVKLSFDGGDKFVKELKAVYRYNANYTVPTWVKYEIDLTPYIDSACVIIAFEAMSEGGTQHIDRIKISSNQDLAVKEIITPLLSFCNLKNQKLEVVIGNETNQDFDFDMPQNQTKLHVEAKENGVLAHSFTKQLTGTLQGLSTTTIEISDNFDYLPANHEIKAFLEMSLADANTANNVQDTAFLVNPSIEIAAAQYTGGINTTDCFPAGTHVIQSGTITNNGNLDISDIPLVLDVWSGNTVVETLMDTIRGTLQAGSSQNWSFAEYTVPNEEYYNIVVTAELECEAIQIRNESFLMECAELDLSDIQVVKILTPNVSVSAPDTVGNSIHLEVRIKNLSPANPFPSINVGAVIYNGGTTYATMTENIAGLNAGDSIDYKFTIPYIVPTVASYTIKVFVHSVDNYPLNDTIKAVRQTDLGINIYGNTGFALGQNIPNPAKENTRIEYRIPSDGQVIFTVSSITGQVLHIEQKDAHSGKNNIEFNTANLADGIYYYSLEYNGERLVKKMTIRK